MATSGIIKFNGYAFYISHDAYPRDIIPDLKEELQIAAALTECKHFAQSFLRTYIQGILVDFAEEIYLNEWGYGHVSYEYEIALEDDKIILYWADGEKKHNIEIPLLRMAIP